MSDPSPIDTKAIRERAQAASEADFHVAESWYFGSIADVLSLCDSLDSATARIAELEAALNFFLLLSKRERRPKTDSNTVFLDVRDWEAALAGTRKVLEGKSNA